MKRRIFLIVLSVMLAASAVGMTACSKGDIYDEYAEKGYDIKIIFDAGEAVVNETQDVRIVEVYSSKNTVTTASGKTGIKLLAPDDERRGDAKFKVAMTDGVNNFFSPGWYTTRTPRVDAEGNPLDSYGELTEVSGREQGYVYSGKWDFEKDVVDPKTLQNGEMTLYAAWIPFISYEIYVPNEKGEFELKGSYYKIDFEFPEWNERTGKLKMNDMIKQSGKTFLAAYADKEMTQQLTEKIDGDALYYDFEKGIANVTTVRIYTSWMEGDWIKVFSAEQLVEKLMEDLEYNLELGENKVTENYILGNDIVLGDVEWPEELRACEFAGGLDGNGYSILTYSNVETGEMQESLETLFGSISEDASLKNVKFDPEVID